MFLKWSFLLFKNQFSLIAVLAMTSVNSWNRDISRFFALFVTVSWLFPFGNGIKMRYGYLLVPLKKKTKQKQNGLLDHNRRLPFRVMAHDNRSYAADSTGNYPSPDSLHCSPGWLHSPAFPTLYLTLYRPALEENGSKQNSAIDPFCECML